MKPPRTNPILSFLFLLIIAMLLAACSSQSGQSTSPSSQEGEPTQNTANSTSSLPLPATTEIVTEAQPTTTGESAQASFDPCAYLTTDEITQVISQTIVNAIPSTSPRPNCHYVTETDANGYSASVVVYVFTDPSAPGGFENGKTLQDENPEPVTGVGDDAYWAPTLDNLNVLYKDVYFTVQFLGTENESLDLAKVLALKVITHMEEKGLPN